MMEKVIEAGSWDGPGMETPATLIKLSSRGLRGNDRQDFLKVASHDFLKLVDEIVPDKGELPIHLNAIGSTEGYGCNRNGDAFSEAHCKKYHDRFVKDARYYANHKNKNPAKSYGVVKASTYNQPMRRIELVIFGNMDKAAAEKNGGLVMKQATIERLERGDEQPYSMATRVAFDVCSNCHNKAANRREYCTEDTCISPTDGRRMFGCADGLTKVASDGRQQFVDNPNPHFFDISEVVRQADRIAMGGLADYFQKAANESGRAIGGAELAEYWARTHQADFELIGPEDSLFRHKIAKQLEVLPRLVRIEQQLASPEPADRAYSLGFSRAVQPDLAVEMLGQPGSAKMASALLAMSQYRMSMPPRDFVRWLIPDQTKQASYTRALVNSLPGAFSRLAAEPELELTLRTNPYLPDQDARVPGPVQAWANKVAADYSLDAAAVRDRVSRAVFRAETTPTWRTKAAHTMPESEELARQYALLKLASLTTLDTLRLDKPDEIFAMAVRENYLDST